MKTDALDEAASFEGVFGVYGYLGPHLCVDITYRTEADKRRRLDVLSKLMGGADPMVIWERHLPQVERGLDALDWRVIQALRGDAMRPVEAIASALGSSVRTVRRRRSRLLEEGSIDIIPNSDPTALGGSIMAEFHVGLGDRAVGNEVLRVLDDQWYSSWTPPEARLAALVVLVIGNSVGDFEAMRARVEALPQVDGVQVLIPSRVAYTGAWIDEAIEERLAALQETPLRSGPAGTAGGGATPVS